MEYEEPLRVFVRNIRVGAYTRAKALTLSTGTFSRGLEMPATPD